MATGKKLNVDLSVDVVLNSYKFGWIASYNQRAICTRILSPEVKHKIARYPKHIKFITRNFQENEYFQGPSYEVHTEEMINLEVFYKWVPQILDGFDISEFLTDDFWNNITKTLERLDFRYETIDSVKRWVTKSDMTTEALKEKESKLTSGQQKYVSYFGAALKCDMKNGTAKNWMELLIQKIVQTSGHDIDDIACISPTNDCSTNTVTESIHGDLEDIPVKIEYDAPFVQSSVTGTSLSANLLSSSSLESLSSMSGQESTDNFVSKLRAVPDLCVALGDFPGSFPLVVKVKSGDDENVGSIQIKPQMLSRLFFQDAIFGLVVTPRSYQVSAFVKHENKLYYLETQPIFLAVTSDCGEIGKYKLDLKSLEHLYTFIHSVLKWALKTACRSEMTY